MNACFIGGICRQPYTHGVPVYINANGQLGTTASSARFKDEIKPMDKGERSDPRAETGHLPLQERA